MNISHLKLTSISFEMRYEPAFALYDDSGKIWSGVRRKWPNLKPVEAQPNSSKFVVNDEAELGILIDKSHVIWPGSKFDSKKFSEYAEFVTAITTGTLDVTKFTRLGLRQIFIKRFPNAKEANDAIFESGLLKVPDATLFGVDGQLKNAEFGFRNETDSVGWYAKIFARSRKFNLEPPLGDEDIPKIDEEFFEVVFDVDYYTIATTAAGKFKADDWVSQGQRLIRRDSKHILGE